MKNSVKAIRARLPNLGANGAANFNHVIGADKTNHNVQVASSYVSNWGNLTEVEMHYMNNWSDNVLRIASSTTSGSTTTLKFQSTEDAIFFVRPYPQLGMTTNGKTQCFYFENAKEFLDQAGEWYLDETANVPCYKPRTGEDMTTATVVAPMLETVLSVNGTSTSNQAGNLWFQGLTFAHSTHLRPSQYGFLDGQAGQGPRKLDDGRCGTRSESRDYECNQPTLDYGGGPIGTTIRTRHRIGPHLRGSECISAPLRPNQRQQRPERRRIESERPCGIRGTQPF